MTDRQVLISAALGVGAICATVAGSSCSTNARIDDLQANLIDVRDEIQSVRDEIRDEIRSVRDELEGVRGEIRDVRDLLIDHIDSHDSSGPED